jgi:hypothetical protein
MNTKHSSISLCDLLKEYLGIDHSVKGEMHNMMNNDPYFWKKVSGSIFYKNFQFFGIFKLF